MPTSSASSPPLAARINLAEVWRPLTTVVVGAFSAVVLLSFALSGYVLGLAQGLVLTAAGIGVTALVTGGRSIAPTISATAPEDLSRDQLRSAVRRGDVYGWVDNLAVGGEEISHLVLTSHGAVAIDATWHSGSKARAEVTSGIAAANHAAAHARKILAAVGSRVPVLPVAVVWGPGQASMGAARVVGDVHLVPGTDLTDWLQHRAITPGAVEELTARALLAELEALKTRVRTGGPSLDRSSVVR